MLALSPSECVSLCSLTLRVPVPPFSFHFHSETSFPLLCPSPELEARLGRTSLRDSFNKREVQPLGFPKKDFFSFPTFFPS